MDILGIIIIVVGLALLIAGRNMDRHLPPDYRSDEDDGFLQLLRSMGRLMSGMGIAFLIIGLCCIVFKGI